MRSRDAAVAVLVALLVLPVIAHVATSAIPGFASLVVAGGSMEPTIDRGSIVYVQETNQYGPGDVITFTEDGQIITHRIVTDTGEGYVTRGDGNGAADEWRVSERQIVGEVLLVVPLYGYLLSFVAGSIGFVIAVLLPGIVLIGLEAHQLVVKLR